MDSKDNVMWASNSDVSDLRELMIQGIFGLEFRDDSLEYITKQIPNVYISSMVYLEHPNFDYSMSKF